MIRIALLTTSARAYGGDSYVRRLLPALRRYGAGAHFSVIACDPKYTMLVPEGDALRFVRVDGRLLRSGMGRLVWQQLVLPRLLRRLEVDVVYSANNVGIVRSPVPCVVAIRNMEPLAAPLAGMRPRLRTRVLLLRWLTLLSIARAGRVVAVSRFVRDHLVRRGVPREKIDVIYHGADGLPPDQDGDVRGGTGIVSASKFVRYANLTTLMRGYATSRARGVSDPLIFAGGPWDTRYEAEVRDLARRLGIEPYVRFLGYVSHEELLRLARRCRVFVFPSTLEACPFTLLEAMACGAPIITTVAGPMPEIAGDAALYFGPTDTEALADHIRRLADDDALRVEFASRARERAKAFRWKDNVERLIATARRAPGPPDPEDSGHTAVPMAGVVPCLAFLARLPS